jgi:hypothetical protein
MTKVKILALLAGLVLLFTLPATVSAQRLPPHVFVGVAMIDGAAAPEGTTVSAWVAGAEAASTTTTGAGGAYTLIVDQGDNSFAEETVTFLVGSMNADQSAEWMQGGGDELDLSASSGAMPTATPEETPTPEATAVLPATGVPGPRGLTGATGASGAEGPQGERGEQGDTGPQGTTGDAGSKGDTGAIGSQGQAGDTGPQGASGSSGAAGSDGSNVLGIIALILAIVGIVGAAGAFLLSRRS